MPLTVHVGDFTYRAIGRLLNPLTVLLAVQVGVDGLGLRLGGRSFDVDRLLDHNLLFHNHRLGRLHDHRGRLDGDIDIHIDIRRRLGGIIHIAVFFALLVVVFVDGLKTAATGQQKGGGKGEDDSGFHGDSPVDGVEENAPYRAKNGESKRNLPCACLTDCGRGGGKSAGVEQGLSLGSDHRGHRADASGTPPIVAGRISAVFAAHRCEDDVVATDRGNDGQYRREWILRPCTSPRIHTCSTPPHTVASATRTPMAHYQRLSGGMIVSNALNRTNKLTRPSIIWYKNSPLTTVATAGFQKFSAKDPHGHLHSA